MSVSLGAEDHEKNEVVDMGLREALKNSRGTDWNAARFFSILRELAKSMGSERY
jgi:hypothetical protein